MKFQDDIDFTALGWVKSELDATLDQARLALEAYVESSANAGRMRDCVADLHLVHGTLRMVELYGAALVVEEMERVAEGVVDGAIAANDDVLSALMRGIVQLPDYLERLQSGHKDIPIILLPLLNDLRAARGEKLLTESVLFTPDLAAPLPAVATAATPAVELRAEALRLRNMFQRALLHWIRDNQASAPLERMSVALDRLYTICVLDDARRLWWVANGVLDGVRSAAIAANVAIKLLFGKVDREIKRLVDQGESGFAAAPPRDLTKNLLYYLAHADVETARAGNIRELYQLDSLLPSAQELEHAHGSISGHNRALLDTVAVAIKEDLLHVKEALDIFLRAGGEAESLAAQTDVLDRVADTLGMLGLGVPRRVITEQREIISQIALGTSRADEATLLDVAGSLLYVEASLDDHIVRLGVDPLAADTHPRDEFELPKAEIGRILDALTREAAANIAQVKADIIAFVEAPWDHSRVEQIPRLLEEVSGAVGMLGLREAAQLIVGIQRFVEIELLQHRRVPDHEQLDLLADALTSIEYYLEATREQRGGRERILEVTTTSLTSLNYWPVPDAAPRDAAAAHDDEIVLDEPVLSGADAAYFVDGAAANETDVMQPVGETPVSETQVNETAAFVATDSAVTAAPTLGGVDEFQQEVPDPDAVNHGIEFGFDVDPMQALDSEIRDIFLEEVQEEIVGLRELMPLWLVRRDDFERLKQIRRSFHTLKGSGRLVGAKALGDFAWKVENTLNRVLDKTIAPSDPVQILVGHAVEALPDLLAALRGEGRPAVDIVAIKQVADRLAAGEEAWVNEIALRPRKLVPRQPPPAAEEVAAPATQAQFAEAGAGEGLPLLDAMLFDVLRAEVSGHLAVIDAFVAEARTSPDTTISQKLLHATHTLNGAIAMVELPQISQALMPLEGYVKRLQAWDQAPDSEGVAVFAEVSAQIKAAISALERSSTSLPDFSALAVRIVDLRDALPDPELLQSLLASEHDADYADGEAEMWPESELAETSSVGAAPPPTAAPVPEEIIPDEIVTPPAAISDDDAAIEAALAEFEAELVRAASAPRAEPLPADEFAPTVDWGAADDNVATPDSSVGLAAEAPAPQLDATSETAGAGAGEIAADVDDVVESTLASSPHLESVVMETDADVADGIVDSTDAADAAPLEPPLGAHGVTPLSAEPTAATPATDIEPASAFVSEAAAVTSTAATLDEIQPAPDLVEPLEHEQAPAVEPAAVEAALPLPPGWYAPPQIDADLLDIFVQEAEEILDHSDGLMARLRETPQDRELVGGLQRDLHTVKGGAHMSGLTPIGDLSHAMEALLEAISEQRRDMNDAVIAALEQGFDRLHGLVQLAESRQASQMPEAQIRRVEALVAPDIAPPMDVDAVADATAEATEPAIAANDAAPLARAALIDEDEATARTPQEQIRVRADLLDVLVNHAGEVSIYRSRLEQQIAGFRFNLTEFDATVARLREQLRKLELETEVQILSRYQRTDAGASAFDPLELDRFSQLQQLSRSLSESVSDLSSIQGTFDDLTRQSETLLVQQSRVNTELQEGLMRTRMVPFDSLVPALRRTLRQTAAELGKRAQLKVSGAQGEMDRNLLERMKAPFEHMLRNALAHGIESPDEREQAGKPADGAVSIAVSREATEVVLRVADDGRGLDRDAIKRRAIERGMLAAGAAISDRDLYALILDSGFSTAETVTHLSGRGVGMDVVNNEIKQLGGSLAIDSSPGAGANFTVRLPFTLAATQAILVRLGDASYAIPMSSVQGVVRIAREDLERRLASAEPTYSYAGESFVIHELAQLLGLHASRLVDELQVPLLMTRSGDLRAAVRVDAVLGSREIVVKSVGPQISSVPGIFGATIMGDGSVVMILDLPPLLRRDAALRAQGIADGTPVAVPPPLEASTQKRRRLIMVVDDSITMRKATSRVLERQEMDVITAKDGLDAVEKLQDHIPDLVVLDIEMPRMDGYEFATYMKNDVRTRKVPIVMVTSRTGEKHRQRAHEIGVDRYLGKPYQEAELLQNIHDALEALGK
jgi:chemosensory pili system protein ChpA (sensor histidine kinase/response regulator)